MATFSLIKMLKNSDDKWNVHKIPKPVITWPFKRITVVIIKTLKIWKKSLSTWIKIQLFIYTRNMSIGHWRPHTPLICQSYDSRSNIFRTTCATSWKLRIFYKVKGKNLTNTIKIHKQTPRCICTHTDQHSCKLSGLQVKYFLSCAWTSWKLQIYTTVSLGQ
jgi:hypothetical protein